VQIRTFRKLDNDVYRVSIYTETWSEADSLLMAKYGEPEIDLGGSFTSDEDTFTLPTQLQQVRRDVPFAGAFDARDYAEKAPAYALAWSTAISARISAAVHALREQADAFTGETVIGV